MRRLVQRHHGSLPLDTVESIWRVIISTFTYVQAPFAAHADLSAGDALMRDSARFHFGFTVPLVPHVGAASVVQAVTASTGDLGLVPAFAIAGAGPWWTTLEFDSAPKIIARLPFVERADHPAGLPVFVISRVAADAMVTETEVWSVRVSGWNATSVDSIAELADAIAVPDQAFDGAALLVSVARGGIDAVAQALRGTGASIRSKALVGSHATRYTVPAEHQASPLRRSAREREPVGRAATILQAANVRRPPPYPPLFGEGRENEQMSVLLPKPRPGVLDIEAYVPGKSSAPGVAKVFKLSSNETPLGPSPRAIEAYKSVAAHLQDYPDGSAAALREAIGRAFGLDPDRIVCGAGSDDLLNLLARAYLADGDEAIHTTHGFLVYPIATLGTGAKPVVAPETNYTASVDAILAAVTNKTKIVFLANPNNPTGTYISFDEVKRLHRNLPPHVLLVLDAAYAEYVRRNDYESGIELVATSDNVVMTPTFSKIHGLAALRLGWMFGPAHVVAAINRVRGPFNVNTPAIAAGIAAIEDHEHQERAREHNSRWLAWLAAGAREARTESDARASPISC